jgi:hypothetical protein
LIVVKVGNEHAIQVFLDGSVEHIEGQQITTVTVPDDRELPEALIEVLNALGKHIAEGEMPSWVSASNNELQGLLVTHYRLPKTATKPPKGWGEESAS